MTSKRTTPPAAAQGNGLVAYDPADVIDLTPSEDERKPKPVRVGPEPDDVFVAAASVPVYVAIEGMKILTGDPADADDGAELQAERTIAFLSTVLYPEEVDRFHARLRDLKRPIDHRLLFRMLNRLMEAWGLRPTEPSEPSSDGSPSPDAGTSSTAAPPSPAPPSGGSPLTASST
jgi:hypothetical protein